MVKEEVEDILSFWRARQTVDSGKATFRFKKCFADSANRDLQPATYGVTVKQKSTAGGQKKSGKRKTNAQLPVEAGELELTLPHHQESNTQEPVDEAHEGAGQDIDAVPYTLGLPGGGNCNMSAHPEEMGNDTAGGAVTSVTQAKDVPMSSHGGINLDAFNFDPELQQIALAAQPSAYTSQQNEFLQGGLFDNFLESLATENTSFFQDEGALRLPSASGLNDIEDEGPIGVMPGSVHLDYRPGDITLPRGLMGAAQDIDIARIDASPRPGHITFGAYWSPQARPGNVSIGGYSTSPQPCPGGDPVGANLTIARPDVHDNDMGQAMELQGNSRSCMELASRPTTIASQAQAAAEPLRSVMGDVNNMGKSMALDDNSHPNEVQTALTNEVQHPLPNRDQNHVHNKVQNPLPNEVQNHLPNEVQHPLPNEIQDANTHLQNDAPTKRRRGRPRKIIESENTNEQVPSLKRGQDAINGTPDGANKKAKTTKPRKKAAKSKAR